jgi:hypothetical protein
VNDHGAELREAFETHEHLAPDPAAVYARVQELARTYQRRRRGAQAAGGAVLGVGLIAGAINLPGLVPDRQYGTVTVGAAPASAVPALSASASASASASTSPSEQELQKRWDAYFAAGYDYDDALRLAKLWNSKDDVGAVKAEAGRRLLAGERLPVEPDPGNVADAKETARVDAFFAAGYDYDDAVTLAKLWKKPDAYAAKVEAGKRLLAGDDLPIKPGPEDAVPVTEAVQVEAFHRAGYDHADAVRLAELWKMDDVHAVKVEAGKKLLAGDALPIRP